MNVRLCNKHNGWMLGYAINIMDDCSIDIMDECYAIDIMDEC